MKSLKSWRGGAVKLPLRDKDIASLADTFTEIINN